MKIRIITLSENSLIIEGINEHKERSDNYSNSSESQSLKKCLEASPVNLIADIDYTITDNKNTTLYHRYYWERINFSEKSNVMRALFAIPEELYEKRNERNYGFEDVIRLREKIVFNISEKKCYVSEKSIVDATQARLAKQLTDEIMRVHLTFKNESSAVINKLAQDIGLIQKRENTPFKNSNFMLLIAALLKAISTENQKPSIYKKGFFSSFYQPESLLLPKYNEILDKFSYLLTINKMEQICTDGLYAFREIVELNKIYENHLKIYSEVEQLNVDHMKEELSMTNLTSDRNPK